MLSERMGGRDSLRSVCGLPVSTYFSGVKLRWLLDNVPEVKKGVEEGYALVGTVDSWIIWNLTGGAQGGAQPEHSYHLYGLPFYATEHTACYSPHTTHHYTSTPPHATTLQYTTTPPNHAPLTLQTTHHSLTTHRANRTPHTTHQTPHTARHTPHITTRLNTPLPPSPLSLRCLAHAPQAQGLKSDFPFCLLSVSTN